MKAEEIQSIEPKEIGRQSPEKKLVKVADKIVDSQGIDFQDNERLVKKDDTQVDDQCIENEDAIDTKTRENQATATQSSENPKEETDKLGNASSSSVDYKRLVLWRNPRLTLFYCLKELLLYTQKMLDKAIQCRKVIYVVILLLVVSRCLVYSLFSNHPFVLRVQQMFLRCIYWFSLGMLSSVGLGTGVHTFALYLGPYIASVTVAANECGYLDFGEQANQATHCPQDSDHRQVATLWNIMSKVRLESYMWGLGTAVGELPPYFMGRAARISGEEKDALLEIEELERKSPESLTFLDRVKLSVRYLVVEAGFWGILACASIPNPFFDLAGITCGSFLVPFWTFFGATVIGKAIIKTTIQQVFVILSFNNFFLDWVFEMVSKIPMVGGRLETYFSEYIAKQKKKLSGDRVVDNASSGWFSMLYHGFVVCTFFHCFVSIINSLAQSHFRRLERDESNKCK
ncbi:vacuole membrane protein 1-like [Macrosteles quadrilineatus]|uniref:vacuole membrane protein 1-like n=1 Tax=Macrosteles quadrilineatus TaxID=74068 RepID=UPI0023E19B19|nr:vacuole membrane protein 1-like [Macrosteles quadrilineatus]